MLENIKSYKTIQGSVDAEIVEKKSRFIAHLSHVETEEAALGFLEKIRTENQQARHNVYAYILKCGRTRYSDDGEPAQTSGLPTFEALAHAGLTNVICVTTRYFGGVLLGTGGLVRAYTDAANAAIKLAHIVEICSVVDVTFTIPYELNSVVQKVISESDVSINLCEYTDVITYSIRVRTENASDFNDSIVEASRGRISPIVGTPYNAAM